MALEEEAVGLDQKSHLMPAMESDSLVASDVSDTHMVVDCPTLEEAEAEA